MFIGDYPMILKPFYICCTITNVERFFIMHIIPQRSKSKEKFQLQVCSYEARKKFRDAEWSELAAILTYYGIQEIHFDENRSTTYSLVVNFDNTSAHCQAHRVRLVSTNHVEIEVMLRDEDGRFRPYLLNRIDLPLGEVGCLAEYLVDWFTDKH